MLSRIYKRALVDDRSLVRTAELRHMILVLAAVVGPDDDQVGVNVGDCTSPAGYNAGAGVLSDTMLDSRSDDR